ncbi:hypothetical protein BOTBODRAFT_29483 [Botryobasidium botryosum FD-172 SS1]|uniref:Eisosome component PIL1-domain-containing protein n=1 Tax=Botryobasidium botryosum (strain FD-172 SS1) TaxID=930990 RepID=A0A067N1W3_BOTB1|nr:hypothetical protein BOTBODRAFT_29483 [Botryobasidium botryosum FD-172 SS1]
MQGKIFRPRQGGVLGSVRSKIAHTSTIPALGNKDLKRLQDLIAAEKEVMISLRKMSYSQVRAAETLKAWGLGEGDDLGDILSQATALLSHFAVALTQYATHENTMRAHLKAIRTREEKLDETKRRKRSVSSEAEAAERKLSKMSPEHKNLPAQTSTLANLREELRNLDNSILNEEARLSDFKRTTTKDFMALKFGGLLECAEKARIIGEMGKLLIEEIPLETTQPGHPRAYYNGHDKTSRIVSDATRDVGEIAFNSPPPPSNAGVSTTSPSRPSFENDDYRASATQSSFSLGQGQGHGQDGNYSEFGEEGGRSQLLSSASIRISGDGTRGINSVSSSRFTVIPEPNLGSPITDPFQLESYPAPEHTNGGRGQSESPIRSGFAGGPARANAGGGLEAGNPWDSNTQLPPSASPRPQQGRELEDQEDGRSYRRGKKNTKGEGDYNYPYSDDAYFVRNHATSSRPLNGRGNDHAAPPGESASPGRPVDSETAAANAAAAREIAREMDALGFNSLPPVYTPSADASTLDPPSLPPTPRANTSSPRLAPERPPLHVSSSTVASFESAAPRLMPQFPSTPISPNIGNGQRTISAAAFRRTPNRSPTSEQNAVFDAGRRGMSPAPPHPEDGGPDYEYYSMDQDDARAAAGTPTPHGQRENARQASASPSGYASGRFATKLDH